MRSACDWQEMKRSPWWPAIPDKVIETKSAALVSGIGDTVVWKPKSVLDVRVKVKPELWMNEPPLRGLVRLSP